MRKLEDYLRDSSLQKEDDLVFPQQDYLTLTMNIRNLIKADLDSIWKKYVIEPSDSLEEVGEKLSSGFLEQINYFS